MSQPASIVFKMTWGGEYHWHTQNLDMSYQELGQRMHDIIQRHQFVSFDNSCVPEDKGLRVAILSTNEIRTMEVYNR